MSRAVERPGLARIRRALRAEPPVREVLVQVAAEGTASASVHRTLTASPDPSTAELPLDRLLAASPDLRGRPMFPAAAAAVPDPTRRLAWLLAGDGGMAGHPTPGLNVLELPPSWNAHAVADELGEDPRVAYAEVPGHRDVESPAGTDPHRGEQWAIDHCGFPAAWDAAQNAGAPTAVAVVDSGIDTGHEDLAPVSHFATFGLPANDSKGHGTAVTGILTALRGNPHGIVGAAVCPVQAYKVYGPQFAWEHYLETLRLLPQSGVRVANLSIAGLRYEETERRLIDRCVAAGVVVVAAMGNRDEFGGDATLYPAALPSVIAVGASGPDGARAPLSIRGDHVWLAAPGVNLLTTRAGGGYQSVSGTSFAAPLVSAACALILRRRPGLDVVEVRRALRDLAERRAGAGWNREVGWGRLSVRRLAEL